MPKSSLPRRSSTSSLNSNRSNGSYNKRRGSSSSNNGKSNKVVKDAFNVKPMTVSGKPSKNKSKNGKSAVAASAAKSSSTGSAKYGTSTSKNNKMKRQGVTSAPSSGAKTWRRSKAFRFPADSSVGKLLKGMPWYDDGLLEDTQHAMFDASGEAKPDSTTTARCEFPSELQDILDDAVGMSAMGAELDYFARFVRLTDVEVEARNFIIDLIGHLCDSSFSQKSRPNQYVRFSDKKDASVKQSSSSKQQEPEPFRVVTFGSFASRDVCTFTSDVDLAVWGIVAPDDDTPLPLVSNPNLNSREAKILKWKKAIETTEVTTTSVSASGVESSQCSKTTTVTTTSSAAVSSTPQHGVSSSPSKAEPNDIIVIDNDRTTLPHDDRQSDANEDILFVLDRTGDVGIVQKRNSSKAEEGKLESGKCRGGESTNGGSAERQNDADVEVVVLDEKGYVSSAAVPGTETSGKGNSPIFCLSSDDEDAPDKMQSFGKPKTFVVADDDEIESDWNAVREQLSPDVVHESEESRHMEVGFLTPSDEKKSKKLEGKVRKQVVSSLYRLGAALNKCPVHDRHEVRSRAKVPIIALETRIGVDADVALGGHNGADTSQYAGAVLQRYTSFSPVVLLLKLLLRQTDLDKPFTGGLGSYKLYVLVAYHIERHLRNGGRDIPADVLVSFLFRFGGLGQTKASTILSPAMTLSSHGGMADLSPVFRLREIEGVFKKSYERLSQALACAQESESLLSFVGTVLDASKLKYDRDQFLMKAERVKHYSKTAFGDSNSTRNLRSQSTTNGGQACAKSSASGSFPRSNPPKARADAPPQREGSEEEADRLAAGYGMQRGPRGALVPLRRPDLEAYREQRGLSLEAYAAAKVQKNRKNKRKQTYDTPFQDLAARR